jgi:hypothetical protein
MHIHPETSPTKWVFLHLSAHCLSLTARGTIDCFALHALTLIQHTSSCALLPHVCVCCCCDIAHAAMCRIEKNEDGTLTVHYKGKDGQEHSLVAGIVMFGTGRKPNTNRLGIEVSLSVCQLPLCQHHRSPMHQPSCRYQWLDVVTNPSSVMVYHRLSVKHRPLCPGSEADSSCLAGSQC